MLAMARSLNLAVSLILLGLLIITLFGGVGALLGFGYFGEILINRFKWIESIWSALCIIWATGWIIGVTLYIFNIRSLIFHVRLRKFKAWSIFDIPLALGHASVLGGFASMAAPTPWNDSLYFFLMWAGFFYAIGISLFVLRFSPKGRTTSAE